MNVTGVIAEYNPFHNGHAYQLDMIRKNTNADYIIIVMSGNFLQRGTPALLSKYTRTQMALSMGADLVLELPSIFATASAKDFARSGISILDHLGLVTSLCFGCENKEEEFYQILTSYLSKNSSNYWDSVSFYMSQGLSFPSAREKTLLSQMKPLLSVDLWTSFSNFLNKPNNILGIEYMLALQERKSSIKPYLLAREGCNYHDTTMDALASASAIRNAIKEQAFQEIQKAMPESCYDLLKHALECKEYLFSEDFNDYLGYKLFLDAPNGYEQYYGISKDLSNKIKGNLSSYFGYEEFCDTLKSKNITHTSLSRALSHILLNSTKELTESAKSMDYAPYLRVLGFKKSSKELLTAIKKASDLPMITKVSDAKNILLPNALKVFHQDCSSSALYSMALQKKSGRLQKNDYNAGIVIL